jgi:uncharacterized protein involved in exopolysaccharide biosynthesis
MNYTPPKPVSLRDIDFGHYFKHYLHLLWRWKWWILITFPVVFLVTLLIVLRISYGNPKLTTRTLIGLENVSGMTAVQDIGGFENRKTELIKTRSFLAEIVNALSLRLQIKKYHRHTIFDSVYVDSSSIPGKYEFKINSERSDQYSIRFMTKQRDTDIPFWKRPKGRVIESGKLSSLKSLKFQGVHLVFTGKFLRNPHEIKFNVLNMRFAVEHILNNLKIKHNSHIANIEISFEGKDYNLITKIVNTIADAFIQKQSDYKKIKTKKVIEALESQLAKSKDELMKSENKIKNFRLANPSVGLNESTQHTIQSLINLETNAFSINNSLNEARKLQSKYVAAFQEDKEQVGLEIVLFLIANNISSASIFQTDLDRQMTEKRRLQTTLSSGHPNLKQNQEEIDRTLNKIYSSLLVYIKNTEGKVKQRAEGIQNISQKLKGLPSKELQLAELQRAQNIASGIYSQILDRYNKAKVAETIEAADVFIMEYAIPPIPPPNQTLLLIALGISMLFALALGFGPPVLLDFISKTARTEFELTKMTDMVVLETIPKIESKKW